MRPTPFAAGTDLEPIPFSPEHSALAKALKEKGLEWKPHVGCFVWDEKGHIQVSSPFPNRIYFILNLGHFLRIFETIENMKEKLVWLPTWHQAKIICENLNISKTEINDSLCASGSAGSEGDTAALYRLILEKL